MLVKIGTVNPGVAAGAEARSFRKASAVVGIADRRKDLLRVTAKTQIAVPDNQHFVVEGTVDLMAGRAPFPKRFMLPDKGALLLLVTFKTGLVRPFESGGGPRPDLRPVRIVAIGAGHVSFQDGVVKG